MASEAGPSGPNRISTPGANLARRPAVNPSHAPPTPKGPEIDRAKFTTVAHRDHLFCSPLGDVKADRLVSLLALPDAAQVLDVGCGKAELLLRTVARYRCAGTGVDPNAAFLEEARRNAEARGLAGRVTLHEAEAAGFPSAPGGYDAAFCVGASHAYGTPAEAIAALASLVRPGGLVLFGEGYWKRTPDPKFLAALGATEADYRDHAGNVASGAEAELVPLYACVSGEDEWDHYEGLYGLAVERYAAERPDDPDVPALLDRSRSWRETYLRWGRDTLGFGFYLFGKPMRG